MVSLDYGTLRARIYPAKAPKRHLAAALERLFLAWISAAAALVFLLALALAAFGLIGLMQLLYIYIGISGVTVALAAALYCARRNLPEAAQRR